MNLELIEILRIIITSLRFVMFQFNLLVEVYPVVTLIRRLFWMAMEAAWLPRV